MNFLKPTRLSALILAGLFSLQPEPGFSAAENISGAIQTESGYEAKHIFREVKIMIHRNADEYFNEFLHTPLKYFLPGTEKLAGVDYTEPVTQAEYPETGSVRRVFLKDGESANEEILEKNPRYFRYRVWDYSLKQAKPIEYGIGEFRFVPVTDNSFLICWKYSFKLKNDMFPGTLGCLGRALFKWTFIDRDYADYMDVGLNAIKAHAEGKMNRETRTIF